MKILKKLVFIGFLALSAKSPAFASAPRILFTDLTDAPVSGWEGKNDKGAAVTVWGTNLGKKRGNSYVTVGNEDLASDSDYAEWGAVSNPQTARGLQRITFWLNPDIGTGIKTVKVTTADGASNELELFCRDNGSIFFVSTDGSDSSSGKASQGSGAWRTLSKAKRTMKAGDVTYVRKGKYTDSEDWDSVLYFNSGNAGGAHANGSRNNSIGLCAFPGENVQIGDSSNKYSIRHSGDDVWNYWTISKFVMRSNAIPLFWGSGGNFSDDNIRIIGNDISSLDGGSSNTHFAGGAGGQANFYFYGNYSHDAGVTSRGSKGASAYGAYFQGFGNHRNIYVGWNEFCYNPVGRGLQCFGHVTGDRMENVHIHDNYFHHNGKTGAVLGGGDPSGGSAYSFMRQCYFYNNIISENGKYASTYSGIFIGGYQTGGNGGEWYIYNNTFHRNTGGEIAMPQEAAPNKVVVKNNIFYPVQGSPYYVGKTGSFYSGSNNCYYGGRSKPSWDSESQEGEDPMFLNTDLQRPEGFYLKEGSPCIDGGTYDVAEFVKSGCLGNERPQGGGFDIGATEYAGILSDNFSDEEDDLQTFSIINIENDIMIIGSAEGRGTINPDRGDTAKIYFDGPASGEYQIRIFTVMGELVWEDEMSGVDHGVFEWFPNDTASGTYIVNVRGPGLIKTKKLVIIR